MAARRLRGLFCITQVLLCHVSNWGRKCSFWWTADMFLASSSSKAPVWAFQTTNCWVFRTCREGLFDRHAWTRGKPSEVIMSDNVKELRSGGTRWLWFFCYFLASHLLPGTEMRPRERSGTLCTNDGRRSSVQHGQHILPFIGNSSEKEKKRNTEKPAVCNGWLMSSCSFHVCSSALQCERQSIKIWQEGGPHAFPPHFVFSSHVSRIWIWADSVPGQPSRMSDLLDQTWTTRGLLPVLESGCGSHCRQLCLI